MRRWTAVGIAIAGILLLPAPASAGTYDVVSCGAPGAGGVNRAWRAVVDVPDVYEAADCGSAMYAGSSAVPGRRAPYFTSANWLFEAPAGTRITRLVTWRYGQGFCCNGWKVAAYDGQANIIGGPFGETCTAPQGFTPCSFGATGGVSAASRGEYALDTHRVHYSVACVEDEMECPTSNDGGQRYAEFHLYGTAVTLRDDLPPELALAGPLFRPGWRRPGDSQQLVFNATDATGIRRVALGGDAAGASARSCDYTRTVPCSNANDRLTPSGRLGEGVHRVTVTAEDAAGNARSVTRTVRIDGTAPTARIAVARRRTILVDVGDNVSGVARGEIQVRDTTRQAFRSLATTLQGGRLRARMDRGRAHRSDIRVVVEDAAGNRREGLGTKLRITGARAGRKLRVEGGRVTVPNGRAVRLRGRLSMIRGGSVGGAAVIATTTVRRPGGETVTAGRVATGRTGRFSLRLPPGPNRELRLSSPGTGAALGAVGRLSVRVPAASSIGASRRSLSGPGRIEFSGRVRRRGQPLPARGLVIILQGREGGRWSTFADTRTNSRGRWAVGYPFRGVPGTYPIRARIRRQAPFPFVIGHSRTLRVRIR
jgi:hypothetical protein